MTSSARHPTDERAVRPPSPIELLHPDGFLRGSLVIGGACPPWLLSELPTQSGDRADVVILAPTHAEARDQRWVHDAAASSARRLTPDGLVYVLAPSRRRRAVVRELARAGLERESTLVHLPQLESTRHVVTADRRALRHALANLLTPSTRRRAAAAAAAVPGGSLPFRHMGGVGVVMRPPGSRPLLAWVSALVPEADPSRAMLTRTWREVGGSSFVHIFDRADRKPFALAKVRSAPDDGGHEELLALQLIAAGARRAGVEAPAALGARRVGEGHVVVMSAVPGRPAAFALAERPDGAVALLDRIAGWLEEWNRSTYVPGAFPPATLEARLVERVRALANYLPDAAAYEAWLRELCTRGGAAIPSVAAHNDLTTANILVDHARLGIVDWESARERDLPVRDLVYATVDVHFLSGRFRSRTAAFDACYRGAGEEARAASDYLARHRRALGLDAAQMTLCFHACWLEHAANDVRRVPAPASDFLAIAARLARERVAFTDLL